MKLYVWLQVTVRRWGLGPLLLIGGVGVLLVFAGLALFGALFSTVVFAGPEFLVDSEGGGVTTFTPTELDDDGLRIGWGVATATVILGVAVGLLAGAKLLAQEDRRPIFGAEADASVAVHVVVSVTLVLAGALARAVIGGRMGDALPIDVIEGSVDGDLGLWIFEVPPAMFILGSVALNFLYGRARRLQNEMDQVV